MSSLKINEALFNKLAEILKKHQLGEIEYQDGTFKVRIAARSTIVQHGDTSPQSGMQTDSIPQQQSNLPVDWARHQGALKSPMVGICYLAPEPGSQNFVETGSMVNEGQPILIIEAMKVMNIIKSQRSGKVIHIAVKNGEPVEYGQLLIVIE
ncbi:MAG: acetyl-CoA carboxylase, biotin carboxyl carrier protein [Holosporales bacterium]|jgi:acetyl-CoA carboxylase biotin carboxyl carrier protein|nr:acetyl-CoA carboxylase, biotin carboxyl carrier protein [Holosporales bacterium]